LAAGQHATARDSLDLFSWRAAGRTKARSYNQQHGKLTCSLYKRAARESQAVRKSERHQAFLGAAVTDQQTTGHRDPIAPRLTIANVEILSELIAKLMF
jgi:hypothetical protein